MFPMDAVAMLAHAVVAVAPLRLHAATGELTLPSQKVAKNLQLIIIAELLVQHASMLLGRMKRHCDKTKINVHQK